MSAVLLQFPAKTLDLADIQAQHKWMMGNQKKWETAATEGAEYETDPMVLAIIAGARAKLGWPGPTIAQMRKNLAEGRKLIEKRNAVKAWLASIGGDLDSIKDAEQALFFAFDKLA